MGSAVDAIIAQGPKPINIDPTLAMQRKVQLGELQAQQQERIAQAQNIQAEAQLRQQTFADQNGLRRAYTEANGDPDQTLNLALTKYNVSPTGAANWKEAMEKAVQTAVQRKTEENNLSIQHNDQARAGLEQIRTLPPDQRGEQYAAWLAGDAKKWLPDDELANFAGVDPTNDGALAMASAHLTTASKILAEANERKKTTAEVAKNTAETDKAIAETAGVKAKNVREQREQAAQQAGNVTDQASFDQFLTNNPSVRGELGPTYDPQKLARFQRSIVPVEKQPEFDLNTQKARMGLMGNSEYDQFLLRYAQSLGKTPAQLTPQEGMASFQKFAEFKQDPVMRATAIAQRNLAEQMKKIQLDQMPTKEDAQMIADDIFNHRLAPDQLSQIRGRGNGQLGLMVEREMKKTDPNFNWEQSSAEYQLSKSPGFQQQVRYMDYVGSSVDNVIRAADALSNGKVRSINAVKNWTADQLNGVNIAKFNTDRLEVADAIAKILQGGGTGAGTSDKKLEDAQALIRSTDDPAVVRATMGEIKGLIANRRTTLTKGTFMENAAPATEPTNASPQTHALPKVGDNYNGHKVLKVEKIQ